MPTLNPAERQLRNLLRIWTGLFGLGALLFFVRPSLVTDLLHLPANAERFWNSLAVSMMATVTYLAYEAQKDVQRSRRLIRALLVAKAASTVAFTFALWTDGLRLGYLAAGLGCDGPIFIVTALMYRKVFRKGT